MQKILLMIAACCVLSCLTCPKDNDTPTWENISQSPGNSNTPSIVATDNGNVYVVWADNSSSDFEIMFAEKTNSNTWSEAINISHNTGKDVVPFIDVDGDGGIHICWWGVEVDMPGTRIMYRYRDASGMWDAIQILAQSSAGDSSHTLPRIAVDVNNNVFVVWELSGLLRYMCKAPNDTWSDMLTVPNSSASNPAELAADRFGNLHIVWEGGSNNIKYQMRTPDGSWQDYSVISDSALPLIPDISVDNDGVVHITWSALDDNHLRYIYYTNNESGSWSEPLQLPKLSDNDTGAENSIACAGDGTIYVIWENRTENAEGSYENPEIYYVYRTHNNSWSGVYNLSNTQGSSLCGIESIDIDHFGNAHISWPDNQPGDYDILYIMIPADSLDQKQEEKMKILICICVVIVLFVPAELSAFDAATHWYLGLNTTDVWLDYDTDFYTCLNSTDDSVRIVTQKFY